MATIEVEDKGSFVFFRWVGFLVPAEISAVAEKYYPRMGNRNKLFDLSRADLSGLTSENLTALAEHVNRVVPQGAFSKTAFVAGDAESYSTLSRYLLQVFASRVPVEYRVFMSTLPAEDWLGSKE